MATGKTAVPHREDRIMDRIMQRIEAERSMVASMARKNVDMLCIEGSAPWDGRGKRRSAGEKSVDEREECKPQVKRRSVG